MEYKWWSKKKVEYLEIEEKKRQQKQLDDDLEKITPPEIDANIFVVDSSLAFSITFKNKVPITFRYKFEGLYRPRNIIEIPSYPSITISPIKNNTWAYLINRLSHWQRPESGNAEIKINIDYQSIHYPLSGDPKLRGQLNKRYMLDWDKRSLTEMR